jgi:hypothetical protein
MIWYPEVPNWTKSRAEWSSIRGSHFWRAPSLELVPGIGGRSGVLRFQNNGNESDSRRADRKPISRSSSQIDVGKGSLGPWFFLYKGVPGQILLTPHVGFSSPEEEDPNDNNLLFWCIERCEIRTPHQHQTFSIFLFILFFSITVTDRRDNLPRTRRRQSGEYIPSPPPSSSVSSASLHLEGHWKMSRETQTLELICSL